MRIYADAAIPGINDTGTVQNTSTDPTGTKSFPNLTAAQSAANAKAAGTTPGSAASASNPLGAAGGSLGKNEFLQLLVQEMTNQDPLKPADNTQFIAQLAQFSTLEQMQNLNDSFGKLQTNYQMSQATALINATVTSVDHTSGAQVDGVVDKVVFTAATSSSTQPTIQVDVYNPTAQSNTLVDVADITSVSPTLVKPTSTGSGSSDGSTPPAPAPKAASSGSLPGTLVPPSSPTSATNPGTGN